MERVEAGDHVEPVIRKGQGRTTLEGVIEATSARGSVVDPSGDRVCAHSSGALARGWLVLLVHVVVGTDIQQA